MDKKDEKIVVIIHDDIRSARFFELSLKNKTVIFKYFCIDKNLNETDRNYYIDYIKMIETELVIYTAFNSFLAEDIDFIQKLKLLKLKTVLIFFEDNLNYIKKQTDVNETREFLLIERPYSAESAVINIKKFLYSYKGINEQFEPDHRFILNDEKNFIIFKRQKVSLSKKEYILFKHLLYNKNKPQNKSDLQKLLNNSNESSDSVSVYIKFLRDKIDRRFNTEMIKTIRGKGYIFKL